MSPTIPPKRRELYYFGIALTCIGVLLVFVGFLGFVVSDFRSASPDTSALSWWLAVVIGICMAVLGGFVMRVSIRGAAALNPETARDAEKLPFDEELRRLRKLQQEGIISEQEYETTKQRILDNLEKA